MVATVSRACTTMPKATSIGRAGSRCGLVATPSVAPSSGRRLHPPRMSGMFRGSEHRVQKV